MKLLITFFLISVSLSTLAQTSPIVIQKNDATPVADMAYEKFTDARTGGKALQLVGTAVLTTSIFLIMNQHNDAVDAQNKSKSFSPNKLPIGLAIGGGAMIMAGIVLDIRAIKHLKRKR